MIDAISQAMLTLFSLGGVGLSVIHDQSLRRWSPVLGLMSQPFWLYTSYTHQQWGIFAVSFVYLIVYGYGMWNFWLKPKPKAVPLNTAQDYHRMMDKLDADHQRRMEVLAAVRRFRLPKGSPVGQRHAK